jgi:hypothetical protein
MAGAPLGGLDAGLDGSLMRPASEAGSEDAGSGDACAAPEPEPAVVVDETLCAAVEDPDRGHSIGSGINLDFAVQCDPELLLCVLSSAPPSLR